MDKILLTFALFTSFPLSAHYLVHQHQEVVRLQQKQLAPFYRRFILKWRFQRKDKLKILGPFLRTNRGEYLRYFKIEKACFEVNLGLQNQIRCLRCSEVVDQLSEIRLQENPAFKRVEFEALQTAASPFVQHELSKRIRFNALKHTYSIYKRDQKILGEDNFEKYPKTQYNIELDYQSNVSLAREEVVLRQRTRITSSDLGITPGETSTIDNKIRITRRDYIFKSDRGEFIVIPWKPVSYRNQYKTVNPNYLQHVVNYHKELYQKDGKSYCFRPDPHVENELDCRAALRSAPPAFLFHTIKLVRLDFNDAPSYEIKH